MNARIKWSLCLLGFSVAAWSGWEMWTLYQQEKLWGHWPLAFFCGFWLFVKLLGTARWQKQTSKWRWLGLSTLAGLFLSAGFPPSPFTFLMFIGFVPLLTVEKEITSSGGNAWTIFRYSYHTFVVWNILTTFWVANTAFAASIVAIWLNSFFMCVPFVLFHWTKKRIPRLAYLSFVVYWLSFEMVHLRWEISWPWLTLGNAFAQFPSWVQWYEFTGALGGTLWILLANFMIFNILERNFKLPKSISRRNVLKISGLLGLPFFTSLLMYYTHQEKGESVEIVIIQPNFEPHYEKFTLPDRIQIERFLRLSEQSVTPNTDFLVFPETSFGLVNVDEIKENKDIQTFQNFLSEYPKLKLVTGINSYRVLREDEPSPPHVRSATRSGVVFRYELFNAAIQLKSGSTADSIPHYKKSKLVPGAEFIPYKSFFFFIQPIVEQMDGSTGHGTQTERSTFDSDSGRVAPVICYESVYGEYLSGYVRHGANVIFIMTNDGWWDNTAGHKQHLKFASLRAIETRRSIARSANTGISGFVNQRGDILQATNYGVEAAVRGNVLLNEEVTFYVKWGDLIGRIAIFTSLILLLNTLVKLFTPQKSTAVDDQNPGH